MTSENSTFFQKATRFWLAATSLLGTLLVLFIVAIIVMVATSDDPEQSKLHSKVLHKGQSEQIAVVDISGVIVDDVDSGDPFSLDQGIASVRDLSFTFDELQQMDEVKAVVLRINSPGGAVVASDELYLAVKELSENKLVVAQLNDTAASGGYYAALGADTIVANKATITGSIGVIAQFPEFTELLEKVGVEVRTIKSGDLKDIGAIDREMTEQERAILQSIIDDAYQQFVDAVATSRNLPREEVINLADGRIYSGLQAQEVGLVDEIGSYDQALELARTEIDIEDPTIIEYNQESFFSMLFASVQGLNPTASISQIIPSNKFGIYYMLSL